MTDNIPDRLSFDHVSAIRASLFMFVRAESYLHSGRFPRVGKKMSLTEREWLPEWDVNLDSGPRPLVTRASRSMFRDAPRDLRFELRRVLLTAYGVGASEPSASKCRR